jgi:Leucine-rich repeat (LRR) protein
MDSEQVSIKTGASGEVVSVSISRAPLGDLSAFAALRSLKDFRYSGHWRDAAPVSDLTPLAGLPLESLVMSNTKVGSVEPIRGMKLKRLALTKCPLKDIKPLQAMKLESIDLSGTKVFDFSYLKGMPLKSFAANGTSLKNVSFLRGMKLESLSITDTPVYDFSVFARMPIKTLNVSETQFKHLSQMKDCPLESLRANGSKISDLSGLKSFASTLKTLELNNIIAKKFDVLKALDLTRLSLVGTQFKDPSILSHMELTYLNLDQTRVASIDAVNFEKMVHLSIQKTEVSSIAKLRGSQLLARFYCRGASVRDFSPIYGTPIVYMTLDGPARKKALYRKLPKLVNVNGQNIHGRPVWR